MWGIVFVLVEPWLSRSPGGYWVGSIIFGAIFPTLVAWFVVLPLKGLPVGNGFHFPGILVGPIVNGVWGLGTALFLSWSRDRFAPSEPYRIAAVIAAPRSCVPAFPPRSGVRIPPSASTSVIARSTAAAARLSPR